MKLTKNSCQAPNVKSCKFHQSPIPSIHSSIHMNSNHTRPSNANHILSIFYSGEFFGRFPDFSALLDSRIVESSNSVWSHMALLARLYHWFVGADYYANIHITWLKGLPDSISTAPICHVKNSVPPSSCGLDGQGLI